MSPDVAQNGKSSPTNIGSRGARARPPKIYNEEEDFSEDEGSEGISEGEEEPFSEEENYVPPAKKGRGRPKAPTGTAKKSNGVKVKQTYVYKDDSEEEAEEATSEEEFSDEEPPAKKKKTAAKGRGRPAKSDTPPAAAKKGRGRPAVVKHLKAVKKTEKAAAPSPYYYDVFNSSESELDAGAMSDESGDWRPTGAARKKKRPVKKGKTKRKDDDDSFSPKKSKGKGAAKKGAKAKKKVAAPGSSVKKRGRPAKEGIQKTPTPSKKGKGRGRPKKSAVPVESEDDEKEEAVDEEEEAVDEVKEKEDVGIVDDVGEEAETENGEEEMDNETDEEEE